MSLNNTFRPNSSANSFCLFRSEIFQDETLGVIKQEVTVTGTHALGSYIRSSRARSAGHVLGGHTSRTDCYSCACPDSDRRFRSFVQTVLENMLPNENVILKLMKTLRSVNTVLRYICGMNVVKDDKILNCVYLIYVLRQVFITNTDYIFIEVEQVLDDILEKRCQTIKLWLRYIFFYTRRALYFHIIVGNVNN